MSNEQSSCNEPGMTKDLNIDPVPPFCRQASVIKSSGTIHSEPFKESQKDPGTIDLSWLEENTFKKTGNGFSGLCDPQQTGHIINEQDGGPPNRGVVYRYQKSVRGTDEAMKDLFNDLVVIDDNGKAHNVPIMWASQEAAVMQILQENVRKDNSLVVDRIKLPMMSIWATEYKFANERYIYHKAIDYLRNPQNNFRPRFTTSEKYEHDTVFGVTRGIPLDIGYTLYAWTLYEEDMNQILTQILTKMSRMAYIRVKGISWEVGVRLDSISNNVEVEPGDKKSRVFKYQFGFTAETFVAQPIVRNKAVLKTRVEITDTTDDEDISEVLARLEQAVKDLER